MKALAILATYNERENIADLIEAILKQDDRLDVLVIDDNSPDGTGRIVDEIAEQSRRVSIIHREGKLGLGTASVRGLQSAIERGYDFAIVMDADFSHDPERLPAIIEKTARYDLVIGSRYIEGGGVVDWGLLRIITSSLTNVGSRLLLRIPAHDVTGAYRAYRVSLLKELGLDRVQSRGYSFQEEMAMLCARAGWRMTEVPITFVNRERGESKVSSREILSSLFMLARLAFGRRRG